MFIFSDSVTEPYFVRVKINDEVYGSGSGASKKVARTKAATEALDKLIPGMKVR